MTRDQIWSGESERLWKPSRFIIGVFYFTFISSLYCGNAIAPFLFISLTLLTYICALADHEATRRVYLFGDRHEAIVVFRLPDQRNPKWCEKSLVRIMTKTDNRMLTFYLFSPPNGKCLPNPGDLVTVFTQGPKSKFCVVDTSSLPIA